MVDNDMVDKDNSQYKLACELELIIGCQPVKSVQEYLYIGLILTQNSHDKKKIHRITKTVAKQKLPNLNRRFTNAHWGKYGDFILPVLAYNTETYRLKKQEKKRTFS